MLLSNLATSVLGLAFGGTVVRAAIAQYFPQFDRSV